MPYTQLEKEFLSNLVSVIFIHPDKELIDQGSRILVETINRRMNKIRSVCKEYHKPVTLEFSHINIPNTNITNAELTIILADNVFYYIAQHNDEIFTYVSNL